jgi:Cu(I)/Ag(I) efflux system membrane fusion protein
MAFDNQGAFWLQPDADTRNPFFGSVMPKCGELKQTFGPKPEPRQPQP